MLWLNYKELAAAVEVRNRPVVAAMGTLDSDVELEVDKPVAEDESQYVVLVADVVGTIAAVGVGLK